MNTSLFLRSFGARVAAVGLSAALVAPLPIHAASSAISIGTVSPTGATVGAPATLQANVSSNAGSITTCNLYVDNDDKGAMTVASGKASVAYTFTSSQVYTVFVFCRDSAGNFNSGNGIAVWAQGGSGGYGTDIVPPNVSSVSPASAEAGKSVMMSATVSDAGGVQSCELFVDSQSKGMMTISQGVATKSHTFVTAKTYAAYVQCKDLAGNTGTGSNVAISVSPASVVTGPAVGSLLKLVCPVGALADHPCKAVYYLGGDGKRHAFPNDKVFFTWYADFSKVVEVSSSVMSSYSLGKNVTYRPGSRMVKFTSVPFVYAVAKGGVLRWIKTEADASAVYGTDWNKKIDDINDALFTSYSYGSDVTPSEPFNVQLELNAAATIDANF